MNAKILLGLLGLVVLLIGAGYFMRQAEIPDGSNEELLTITDADWAKGSSTAPVTLVEYGDFECPACGAYYPLVEEVLKAYPNDVRFVFRHFPLIEAHPKAIASALAAEAAGAQGKFFEMEGLLFTNQEAWSIGDHEALFRQYAQTLQLDMAKFDADRAREDLRDKVMASRNTGIALGVRGTPTFFLNGERITNPRSVDEFKQLIDAAKTNASTASVGGEVAFEDTH